MKWTPELLAKEPNHADTLCIGMAFEGAYADARDPAAIAPLKARFDRLVDRINATAGEPRTLTWSWCDALFMAPCGLARMSALTGEPKYLDAVDTEWWKTAGVLYDPREHLFYRDTKFLNKRTKNGKKIFWSRGNGWVIAGVARVLQSMPADHPTRGKYVAQYKEMAERIAALQSADGTWRSSLLDPDEFPTPETSGTAFHCYSIAWGINEGLLDRDKYLPVVARGWAALAAHLRPDGLPGYVQPKAAMPGAATPTGTEPYGTGAYLLAAVELHRLAPFDVPPRIASPAEGASPAATQPAADGRQPTDGNSPPATEPAAGTKAFARYVPERMDDIAWENDRIAHRIYGPALQHNPREHSGSGIDVWVKSVRRPVVNEWYRGGRYHEDHGTGLDFYEVGVSRGDGGLGVWDAGKLYVSKDWTEYKILDLGPDACGFQLAYAPWDANGRKVWEHRTMTLRAGSNLDRIESTLDSDKPGDLVVGIGLAKREGKGGHVTEDKERGVLSYWQPPEKNGTIGVGVLVDPAAVVGFDEDALNYLVLVKATAGKPFVYYAGAVLGPGARFQNRRPVGAVSAGVQAGVGKRSTGGPPVKACRWKGRPKHKSLRGTIRLARAGVN